MTQVCSSRPAGTLSMQRADMLLPVPPYHDPSYTYTFMEWNRIVADHSAMAPRRFSRIWSTPWKPQHTRKAYRRRADVSHQPLVDAACKEGLK